MSRKKSKMSFVVASLLAIFLTVVAAHDSQAALQAVGPVNPLNGYPQWYQDTSGLQLQLCVGDAVNCLADPVDAANPFSVQIGFGTEAFWWAADALVGGPPPAPDAGLVLATEAAFGNLTGDAQDGFQITFNRVRIRVSGAAANETCTVTHPFNAGEAFVTDAVGVINSTIDFGCVIPIQGGPCDFTAPLVVNALNPISVFLRPAVPPPGTPPGFIATPLVETTISNSPTGNNLFTVDCPSFAAPLTTDLFTIQGQAFGLIQRFIDVPLDHPFVTQIEAIFNAGITGGCAAGPPPSFCPEAPVTRAQMAVFLESSLGRTAPAPCTGTMFADVTPAIVGTGFCNFIEALANAGITGGCAADNPATPANEARFCPNDTVSRGQMAVFIETALPGVIPTCSGVQFGDVPLGHPFCGFIEKLAADGITGGCTTVPRNFCPNSPVTRGEMAVFIVAAPTPLLP